MIVFKYFLKVQNAVGGMKEIQMMDILIAKKNQDKKLFGE